ncbi:hypothetical protein EBU71_19875, partial [bacterium]|nr:hypothetical protein [Candidatus Elulimicrobium humile]
VYYIQEKSTGLYLTTSVPKGFTAPGLKNMSQPGVDEEWVITQFEPFIFYTVTNDKSVATPFFMYSMLLTNFIDFSGLQIQSKETVVRPSPSPNSYKLWDSSNKQWLTVFNYIQSADSEIFGTLQNSDASFWNFSDVVTPPPPPIPASFTINIVISDISSAQEEDNVYTYTIDPKTQIGILTLLQPPVSQPVSVNIYLKAYETTASRTIAIILSPQFNYSSTNYFIFNLRGEVRTENRTTPTVIFESSDNRFSYYDTGIEAIYRQEQKNWNFNYVPPLLFP